MRRQFVKKVLAVMLSASMVLPVTAETSRTEISAKAQFVKLHTAFKTLKPGQVYKLKLKNNTIGWKVKKAVSKDNTVCKAVNKKTYVKLTAKGEGRTSVWVTLKTAKRKGVSSEKKLRCRVNVKPVETTQKPETQPEPPEPETRPEIQTEKIVSSQAELDAALADGNVRKITIQTDAQTAFAIAAGEHKGVELIVNAPNADVDNSGVFGSVTIKAVRDNTWRERAQGNTIRVEALKTRVVVEQEASVPKIDVVTAGADVKLEVNGSVAHVDMKAALSLEISGSVTEKIPVSIDKEAKGAVLAVSVPVSVSAAADANVAFRKGAENSTLRVTEKTTKVLVDTQVKIEVTKADGTKQTINANLKVTVTQSAQTPSYPSYPGSGSTGGSGGSTGGSGSQSGRPVFAEGYPKAELKKGASGEDIVTVTYKVKYASASNPAEIYNLISLVNNSEEPNAEAVLHGHLGKVTEDYHEKMMATEFDYVRITDEQEKICEYSVGNSSSNEGLTVYSVIQYQDGKITEVQQASIKIEPENYPDNMAPFEEGAYRNRKGDKIYIYFSEELDKTSVPASECFTISPQTAPAAAVVSGVSIAANPNHDVTGNYIELQLSGTLPADAKLSYAKPQNGACIQDEAENKNKTENFEISIESAVPEITSVRVSEDKKFMMIKMSPSNTGMEHLDVFINGKNAGVDAGFGWFNLKERTLILENLQIDAQTDISSVELKAKDGNQITDRAFDVSDSAALAAGTAIETVPDISNITAEYSKSQKKLIIRADGMNTETASLSGCDLYLKAGGKETRLRGQFFRESGENGAFAAGENTLKHAGLPENVQTGDLTLSYRTGLSLDDFGDGWNKGVLVNNAGKPLLNAENIRVTVTN